MALEVYYPDDIRNALLAAEHATHTALAGQEFDGENRLYADYRRGFREGYQAALTTIALAFGLMPQEGR